MSRICHFSKIFRGPGHPLQNKRKIVTSCVPYFKEACITPSRHLEDLEATHSTLKNISQDYRPGDMEGYLLWVRPRARKGYAAGAGSSKHALPAVAQVLEASVVAKMHS